MVLGWTAAAQAVPVDLLKPAVPFDVACDGAVDEAAMLNVVRCWIEECNIELSAIGESDEKHIIRSLLDMDEMPLSALWNSNVKEEIAGLVEPVLERWDRVMANKESLSSSDQKILAMLDSLGLIPAREEGAVFPRLNYAFFSARRAGLLWMCWFPSRFAKKNWAVRMALCSGRRTIWLTGPPNWRISCATMREIRMLLMP